METDPTSDAKSPVPAPPAPEAEEVQFRPFRIFTRRVAIPFIIVGIIVTSLQLQSGKSFDEPGFIIITSLLYIFTILLVLIPRRRVKKKGGIPPLRFGAEDMEIPVSANSRRTRKIPYQKILSVAVFGTKKRAALIIDTKRRAFVYPLRAFADDAAPDKVREILRQRITARADGAAQWQQMEDRQARAAAFAGFRPIGTWGMLCAIALAYAVRQAAAPQESLFSWLDMGANVPGLVRQGEWYRLVTANLQHADSLHLLWNALLGYLIAARVEPVLGTKRFILLVLTAGMFSQCASVAADMFLPTGQALSMGLSGVLLGMLGAQSVLDGRFGSQMPGGYRFSPDTWWLLIILTFGATVLVHEVDVSAYAGGFVAGIALGWALCRGQEDVTKPPPFGPAATLALAATAALWLAAIAQAAVHFSSPDIRLADHKAFVQTVIDMHSPNAEVDNVAAWALATEPKPGPDELSAALTLATRAQASAKQATQRNPSDKDAQQQYGRTTDTLATVLYRQNALEKAIALEEPFFIVAPIFSSQLARFMNAYVQAHGPQAIGATAPPAIRLDPPNAAGDRAFEVTLTEPAAKGVEVYALLMQQGKLRGLLNVSVWPNKLKATGTLLHDAFTNADAADPGAKPAADFSLVISRFDTTACRCDGGSEADATPNYVPLDPEIAKLP